MLTIHRLNHIPRIKTELKCPMCDHCSRKLSCLKNHYNVTHGVQINLHFCPHCQMGFQSPHGLSAHLTSEHKTLLKIDPTSRVQCDQCVKTFPTMNALKAHESSVHREYYCSECGGKKFKNQAAFIRHKKLNHGHGKRFLCSECGKEFLAASALRAHVLHHGEPKFDCPFCDYRSKERGTLKQHMMRIHNPDKKKGPPPNYPCSKCDKGFARKDSLDDHFRVEHTNETWRVWSCETCGKRFTRRGYLQDHLATNGKACEARLEALKWNPDGAGVPLKK